MSAENWRMTFAPAAACTSFVVVLRADVGDTAVRDSGMVGACDVEPTVKLKSPDAPVRFTLRLEAIARASFALPVAPVGIVTRTSTCFTLPLGASPLAMKISEFASGVRAVSVTDVVQPVAPAGGCSTAASL